MPNYDATPGQQFPNSPMLQDDFSMDWGANKNYNPLQLSVPQNTAVNPFQATSPKFSLLPGGGAYGETGDTLAGIGGGEQLSTLDPAAMNGFNTNLNFGDPALGGGEPDAVGGWLDKGKFGLGAAKVGLGIYNAMNTAKMNKFMRGYYGDQMDLQKADFANSARSTNTALEGQRERQLDSQGYRAGTDENRSRVDDYMKQHGVDERA